METRKVNLFEKVFPFRNGDGFSEEVDPSSEKDSDDYDSDDDDTRRSIEDSGDHSEGEAKRSQFTFLNYVTKTHVTCEFKPTFESTGFNNSDF